MSKLNELKQLTKKIANYNFASETGREIQDKIEVFIAKAQESGVSREEIESQIAQLQDEAEQSFRRARIEKFEKGIIPFRDTDDNEWYTPFAAEAKKSGFVKGTGVSDGAELNPAGNTNLAEAMAMFARVVGEDPTANPGSAVGKRMPDWARASAATLEKNGVNLDSIFGGKKASDTVSRAEVARLLQQVFNLPTGNVSHFSDINEANSAELDAIGAVNRADIMTGEGGTDRFNVRGPLNRAALVKILTLISQ